MSENVKWPKVFQSLTEESEKDFLKRSVLACAGI
jgi:hypothetical protein